MRSSVTQEHGTGCAVACVAYIVGVSYQDALKGFERPEFAWGRGYYCKEIVCALKKFGKNYSFTHLSVSNQGHLKIPNVIVFLKKSSKYPVGHFLALNSEGLWMNPWLNHPLIAPAESGFQSELPGIPSYVIFPNSTGNTRNRRE